MYATLIIACLIAGSIICTQAKNKDKYLLSKCHCSADRPFDKPDCDFAKLSKTNLLDLVERLQSSRIICVLSDGIPLPTFSPSVFGSITEASSEKILELHQKAPSVHDASKISDSEYHVQSKCSYDGLSIFSDGIHFMYPTTVITDIIIENQIHRRYNEDLKNLLLEFEEEDEGCPFNLHGGYRTKDGLFSRDEPPLQWLKSEIRPRVQKLLSLTNSSHIEFEIDGWGAVMRETDSQNMHVHPGSMYAGVYYVDAPPEIALSSQSHGCLRFHDPRKGAEMAQVVRGKSIYGATFEICPEPNSGLLVIFPSWLMHEVKSMHPTFTGPRIAISFNINIKHF